MTKFATVGVRLSASLVFAVSLGACRDRQSTDPSESAPVAVTVSARSVPADGASLVEISAMIPPETRSEARQISFAATVGTLLTVAAFADKGGRATAVLRAPSEEAVALVRATAGGVSAVDSILFTKAPPEQLELVPERLAVRATGTDEVKVTANLRRSIGRPSPGARVAFAATDSTGTPIGLMQPTATSDAGSVASSRFNPGTTLYRGIVHLRAFAQNLPTVTDAVIITIVP